jgi:hypothetical protein
VEAWNVQEDEVSVWVSEQGLIPEPERELDWDLAWQPYRIKAVGSKVVKWVWSWWVELSWEVSEMVVVDCLDHRP